MELKIDDYFSLVKFERKVTPQVINEWPHLKKMAGDYIDFASEAKYYIIRDEILFEDEISFDAAVKYIAAELSEGDEWE